MSGDGSPAGGGEAAARAMLEALYVAQRQRLFAYLWSRSGDREDALDLLQELFLRAWRHVGELTALPPERRVYWLFAAARHLSIDRFRGGEAARRAAQRIAANSRAGPPADADLPGNGVEAQDTLRRLNAAVAALPPPWRESLALTVLGGMTSAEAGAALGVPAATVRYRLMRARQALQRTLAESGAASPAPRAVGAGRGRPGARPLYGSGATGAQGAGCGVRGEGHE